MCGINLIRRKQNYNCQLDLKRFTISEAAQNIRTLKLSSSITGATVFATCTLLRKLIEPQRFSVDVSGLICLCAKEPSAYPKLPSDGRLDVARYDEKIGR